MAEPPLGSRDSRLLIVDDEKRDRDTLAAILEAEGFDVTACATAQEALAHLLRGGFGVAIVDLRLDGQSGMQLLQKLHDLAGHVHVIIHTAYSSYESARDAVNLGAFGYVEKGGDPGELVRHVHRAFQARLRRYAQELETAVAERTRELQEANAALRQEIAERKRLEREVLEISDGERRRIGQELHDGVRQELTGIRFMAGALVQKLAARSAPEAEDAEAITRLLDEAAEHTRVLAGGMCPLALVHADFLPALEQLASTARDRFKIACDLRCDALPDRINDTMATHLYHIAQEAVANAVEHAKAKHIEIDLATKGDATTLTVRDDGLGLPESPSGLKGLGLRIMRYRAGVMGGSLDVRRQAAGGTIIVCSIPASAREGEGGVSVCLSH